MTIAHVATDAAIGRTFDYLVPSELEKGIAPGTLVKVEFHGRELEGFVMSLSSATNFSGALKPIKAIAQGEPLLSPALLRLARWMASYYMAPLELCLKAMFPPVVRGGVDKDGFLRRKVIRRHKDLLLENTATLTSKQKQILDWLGDGEETLTGFCEAWHVAPDTLRRMAKLKLLDIVDKIERRDPMAGRKVLPTAPLTLNPEQSTALAIILKELSFTNADALTKPRPILLHGVTASGKTEVYLQAIAEVLRHGKSAIVLVPEIALTPQTIRRFAARFGEKIAVLHSALGAGERHDEWHRIHSGEARLVIGPRSALFAPVRNLGMIIVDEEHEPTYKQSDETPRYNARDVAVVRGLLERCPVVLGSATPSLESWHNAQSGKYALATIRHRATEMSLPHTTIVDMRGEIARNEGKRPVFSTTLIDAIRGRLDLGEQVMLFLNRRGYAPKVICSACGHTEDCEQCSIGMTYHRSDRIMRCHICGAFRPLPMRCPVCGEEYKMEGIGTQRAEDITAKIFPNARIERMDLDVTTRKYSHEEILGRFRAGKTDILIGTQMIAKGLDFPNVTLAGVLNADSGLGISDFRANERTFQLIAQMAGRAGRGLKPGDVIIQTFQPEHPAIVYAQSEDYTGFAKEELDDRQMLRYPPFTHLSCITFRGPVRAAVAEYAARFASAIGRSPDDTAYILGDPVPAAIERTRNMWRFQLTIRGEDPSIISTRIRAAATAYPPPYPITTCIDIDAW